MNILKSILDKYPKPFDMSNHDAAILEIMETGKFKVIVIEGDTPSFNDGDRCRHGETIYIDGFDEYGSKDKIDSDYFDAVKVIEWIRVGVHDTDFRLTYTLQSDGTLEFKKEEYNSEW
jgi:hypothetical protein